MLAIPYDWTQTNFWIESQSIARGLNPFHGISQFSNASRQFVEILKAFVFASVLDVDVDVEVKAIL